jgi:hypothetical protein
MPSCLRSSDPYGTRRLDRCELRSDKQPNPRQVAVSPHYDGRMTTPFEGDYRPGYPGVSTMPVAVLGRGTIAVGPDGLTIVGTRKKRNPLLGLAVVLAMIITMFFIGALVDPNILGTRTPVGKSGLMVGTLIGLAGGIAAAAILGRGTLVPWQFSVPWQSVRKVEVDARGELVVMIKGMSPKGTLHFAPAQGAQAMVHAIESAKPS